MPVKPLEKDCEATIIAAAHVLGYRVHGERAAWSRGKFSTPIKGDPGWPDLFIVGHGQAYAVELKRKPREATDGQMDWLDALEAAGIVARVVYVPEGQQGLIDELAAAARVAS